MAFFGSSMGPGEILLVLTVALLLFGSKRLPAIARSLGQALAELRRSAQNLKHELLQDSPAELTNDQTGGQSPQDHSATHPPKASDDSGMPPHDASGSGADLRG